MWLSLKLHWGGLQGDLGGWALNDGDHSPLGRLWRQRRRAFASGNWQLADDTLQEVRDFIEGANAEHVPNSKND